MADEGDPAVSRSSADSCCKVGRVVERYDLQTMDERLTARWLGRDGERLGLRALASFLNRAVLRAAMQESGLDPLDGEVDDIYARLEDEGPTDRMRFRARSRLSRADIDVEALRRDFVSHPTVGSHLKTCLSVDPPAPDDGDKLKKAEERVFKLQSRTESVVRSSIEHLRDTGRLSAGEFDVLVATRVTCERCGDQYDVRDFLRHEGCDCEVDP